MKLTLFWLVLFPAQLSIGDSWEWEAFSCVTERDRCYSVIPHTYSKEDQTRGTSKTKLFFGQNKAIKLELQIRRVVHKKPSTGRV